VQDDASSESYVYDLIGVLNHLGSMAGGHYIATWKATPCSKDGREEVAFLTSTVMVTPLPPSKRSRKHYQPVKYTYQKVEVNQRKVVSAAATAKAVGESAEPLWFQAHSFASKSAYAGSVFACVMRHHICQSPQLDNDF
jgi:hypothetical protein